MKYIICFIFCSLLIHYASACENNASFDLCMKTANRASSSCEEQDASTSCQCLIQKQMLACYSECNGDEKTFELESQQMKQIQSVCNQPNAELEQTISFDITKQNNLVDDDDNNNSISSSSSSSNNSNDNNNVNADNGNNINSNNNNNANDQIYHMESTDFGRTHADEFIDYSQDPTSSAIINTTMNTFTVLILLFLTFLFIA